jgi:predicted GNAT family acetyltransferase
MNDTQPPPAVPVNDNRAAHRFELSVDGQVAFLNYDRTADTLVFVHTEVPLALRGRHLGDVLVKAGLDAARREGLRIVAQCPFVKSYLQKHPESV